MTENPYIVEVTETTFDEQVIARSRTLPVLVDFWADWCAPCKMLMPILAKVVQDYAGKFVLAKVNTDHEQRLAGRWQVRSLPTVKLFINGSVVDEFMGVQQESAIRDLLDRYIERQSDVRAAQAIHRMEQGHIEEGLQQLRQAVTDDPDNIRLPPLLIQALLHHKRYAEAQEVLQDLPLNLQTEPELEALAARLNFALSTEDSPDEVTLMERIAADDGDLEARFLLASHYVIAGDHEAALAMLLEILRRDKAYRNGQARENMISIFNMLGSGDPLVSKYRSQMARILM